MPKIRDTRTPTHIVASLLFGTGVTMAASPVSSPSNRPIADIGSGAASGTASGVASTPPSAPVSPPETMAASPLAAVRRTMPVAPGLALYVLIPILFLAVPLALLKVAVGPDTSLVVALFLWSATVMVGWIASAIGSEVVYRLFARWRPPLWVITLGGPLAIGFLLRQPILEILTLAQLLHPETAATSPPATLSFDFLVHYLYRVLPGTLAWMLVNYIFDRVLDVPRYRYAPKAGAEDAPAAGAPRTAEGDDAQPPSPRLPALLQRLPQAQRGTLLALKSDDHYVRVYTDAGEALILMRLSDAIRLAAPVTGMQVHRSHWVANEAVRGFQRTGHTGTITLSSGLEIAVSRSYVRDVERKLRHLPHG